MKTGDSKQAVILGVVAVLAIAFLVIRILPKKGDLLPLLGGRTPLVATAEASNTEGLTMTLVGNPFSHPRLAPPAAPKPIPSKPMGDIDKAGGFTPVTVDSLPDPAEGARDPAAPEESAGSTRQQEQEPRIELKAIMRVDGPVALLAFENEKADLYKPGDTLGKGVQILSIGESDIVLDIFGKKRRLQVGGSLGTSEKQ